MASPALLLNPRKSATCITNSVSRIADSSRVTIDCTHYQTEHLMDLRSLGPSPQGTTASPITGGARPATTTPVDQRASSLPGSGGAARPNIIQSSGAAPSAASSLGPSSTALSATGLSGAALSATALSATGLSG